MKRLSPQFWQSLLLFLIIGGILALALGGYLAPMVNGALSPIIGIQEWISTRYLAIVDFITFPRDVAALRQRNAELENKISSLETQVIQLQQQLSEAQLFSSLLDFAGSHLENQYKGATVIGQDPVPFLRYVQIDKGSDDGLRHGMPVVTQQGLVGRVDAVTAGAARVQLITDSASSVNVRLQNSQADALLTGSVTGELTLQMIPQDVIVKPGELVLTSGLGGNYPKGIVVGQVITVRKRETDLFQTASIQPASDLTNLRAVLYITNFRPVDLPACPNSLTHPVTSLVSVPILLVALILQSVVLSRLPLVNGTADLILLVLVSWALQEKADDALVWALLAGILVSFVSAVPGFAPLLAYLLIVFLVRQFQRRIWQAPILAMFAAALAGTIIQQMIYIIALFIAGNQLPFQQALSLVTFPSALLNLLLSLPVYVLITDLAKLLYPVEVEV